MKGTPKLKSVHLYSYHDMGIFNRLGKPSCCHAFVFLKSELFPTVVIVDIPFPIDCRELFRAVSVAVWICSLKISLRSEGKGMSTITTVGIS